MTKTKRKRMLKNICEIGESVINMVAGSVDEWKICVVVDIKERLAELSKDVYEEPITERKKK